MLPLAHAGSDAALVLFLAPVVVLVGMLGWAKLKERRAGVTTVDEKPEPTLDDIMDGKP